MRPTIPAPLLAPLLTAALLAAAAPRPAAADALVFAPAAVAYADEKGAPLRSPEGVACADDGRVAVADTGNRRLVRYAWKDGALSGGREVKLAQLVYPVRAQFDDKGRLLVVDRKMKRIVRVGPDDSFQGYVEYKGLPPPGKVAPASVKPDRAGNLYVLDAGAARILVLDGDDRFLRKIDLPRDGAFMDLAVDARGVVFTVDARSATVYTAGPEAPVATPLGASLANFASYPTSIATDNKGLFFLVDEHGNGIVAVGQDGAYRGRHLSIGWSDGFLYYPGQLCLNGAGDAFVADRNNDRMQIFATGR